MVRGPAKTILSMTAVAMLASLAITPSVMAAETSAGTNLTFIGSSTCEGGHGVMCAVNLGPDNLVPGAKFTYPAEMDKTTYTDRKTYTVPDTYEGKHIKSISLKGYINYGDLKVTPGATLVYSFYRYYAETQLGEEGAKYTTLVNIDCQHGQPEEKCSGQSIYADSVGGDDSEPNWSKSNTIKFNQVVTTGDDYSTNTHTFYRNYDPSDMTALGTDSNMDDVIDAPDEPTRDGYVFDGWWTRTSGGIQVEDGHKASEYSGLTADQSFYAHWKETEKSWTVTFDTDGGDPVPSQKVEDGMTATRPSPDPTKEGYTFAGWYTGGKYPREFDFSTPITADTTVHAKWEEAKPAQHTVTFNTNGGSSVPEQKVDDGAKAVKPADPTKTDYKFAGWYKDSGLSETYDFSTPVTGDLTLYAKWDEAKPAPVMHAVTFVPDNGQMIAGQSIEDGKTVTKPANPTKKGYEFDGWYTDKKFTEEYDFSTPVTKDLTLYAKWTAVKPDKPTPSQHTVTFDTNGGSTISPVTVEDGKPVAKPTDPTRTGYKFAGWFTDAKLTVGYDFSKPVTSDLTLFAEWEKDDSGTTTPPTVTQHTVTFDTDGGTTISPVKVDDGKPVGKPADPSKDGYEFAGWYTDSKHVTGYDFTKPVTSDLTLYAKWTRGGVKPTTPAKKHTVSFDTNGGSIISPIEVNDGDTLNVKDPTRTGYKFAGWYTDEKLTAPFDPATHITSDLTLYAKWDENKPSKGSFTVTFDAGDGVTVESQTVTEGDTLDKPADPTKPGYTFAGWYTDSTLTKPYDFSQPVDQDLTLYGKWNENAHKDSSTHTVTFNTNGGTNIDPVKVQEGEQVKKPADPTRDGFTFAGWYADDTYATPFDFTSTITSDLTLYAKWDARKFTITLDPGNGQPTQQLQVENGQLATLPDAPTRDGYTFDGWYTDKGYRNRFDPKQRITGDMTLYAKWTPTTAQAARLAATGIGFGLLGIGIILLTIVGVGTLLTRRRLTRR